MKFYDELMLSKCNSGDASPKHSVYRQQEVVMNQLSDKEGLDKAYANADKLFVIGNTMYVAGTSYLQDAWDDFKNTFRKNSVGSEISRRRCST